MAKAWFLSIGVIAAGICCYYLALYAVGYAVAYLIGWAIPFAGGAAGAFVAPRRKVPTGVAISIFAVMIMALGGYIAGSLGFGDFVGLEGTLIGTLLMAPFIILVGGVGAVFGEWLASRLGNA